MKAVFALRSHEALTLGNIQPTKGYVIAVMKHVYHDPQGLSKVRWIAEERVDDSNWLSIELAEDTESTIESVYRQRTLSLNKWYFLTVQT